MTVEVDRDALAAALRQVASVVPSRTTIPVLSNLLLDADDGWLSVTGTDLDLQASVTVPIVAGSLRITVDAAKFVAAVESHKPGALRIEMVSGRAALTVKQGRAVRTLPTLPVDNFPLMKVKDGAVAFGMPASALSRLLDTTHIASSSEETRYYLMGVFLHVTDGRLRAAATDGHKLVRADMTAPDGAAGLADAIVPTRAVVMLRKLLAKSSADVDLAISREQIVARHQSVTIVAKLIDGTFPDYTRVIPPVAPTSLRVGRTALAQAVAAVAAVINAEGDKVKYRAVAIEPDGAEGCEVLAQDNMGASACEPLEATVEGPKFKVGFNGSYVRALADIFTDDATLTINTAGATAPALFTSDKDPDLVAVLMPLRV